MAALMEYKGYSGSIAFSEEDGLFYGKLQVIRALVSYEAADPDGLRRAFEEAVEDYRDLLATLGRDPHP